MVLQAFPGHKGPVSCLAFRQGTSELFSGSFDRSVKIWNVEDRAYINTLFGHQSEVLSVDCLRKERVLTVGRDRTAHLFKVTTRLWSKGVFFFILKKNLFFFSILAFTHSLLPIYTSTNPLYLNDHEYFFRVNCYWFKCLTSTCVFFLSA